MKRLLPILVGVLVVVGGLIGLLAYVSSRDTGGIEAGANGSTAPGVLEQDRGAAHEQGVAVGEREGQLPSSGPHEPRNVTNQRSADNAALLHAMEIGDVVITYPDPQPPPALAALQEELTGPFDAELAAAGQMVILVRRPAQDGIEAVAWRRRLSASGPDDPQLRTFAEAWVGKGKGHTG